MFARHQGVLGRRYLLWPAALLVVVGLLFGGASRLEVIGSTIVLIVAFAVGTLVVFRSARQPVTIDRGAMIFVGGFALVALLQLVPLPFAIWSGFPGRDLATQVYRAIGETPWQPITLAPARTAATFFALFPPLVAFTAASALDTQGRKDIVVVLIVMGVVSALLGILQVAGGEVSALRFYRITDNGSGVGLFANPNHQGTLLAVTTLMLFVWLGDRVPRRGAFPGGAAVAAAALLVLLMISVVATRSRAAIAFMAFAIAVGIAIQPFDRIDIGRGARRWLKWCAMGAAVAAVAGLSYVMTSDRVRAFFEVDAEESRLALLPRFGQMIVDHFPFGSGFGSFDPVYRTYETLETYQRTYLNQAHNEPVQLLVEAGVAGLILILGAMLWIFRRAFGAWRGGIVADEGGRVRRAATAAVLIAVGHSLVDYPLRTSGFAIVFAVCCALMLAAPDAAERLRRRERRE